MWFSGKINIEEFGWNWLIPLKPPTCARPKVQAPPPQKNRKRKPLSHGPATAAQRFSKAHDPTSMTQQFHLLSSRGPEYQRPKSAPSRLISSFIPPSPCGPYPWPASSRRPTNLSISFSSTQVRPVPWPSASFPPQPPLFLPFLSFLLTSLKWVELRSPNTSTAAQHSKATKTWFLQATSKWPSQAS